MLILPLLTEVYDPKTFIPHAASLRQAFAHCAIFPTAASRRSLDRVPVPMWLIILLDQLPIVALVGRYRHQLANGTADSSKSGSICRGPLSFIDKYEAYAVLAAVSSCYSSLPGRLSTCYSPVRHFTRVRRPFHVRLACVRHAASVQSEPESNSPVEKYLIQRT